MKLFEKTMQGFNPYFVNESRDLSFSDVSGQSNALTKSRLDKGLLGLGSTKTKNIIEFNETDLSRYFSPSPLRFSDISIGGHPDFEDINHNETTMHNAVSFFMDIKGSTGLIGIVRDLEELRLLKDNILTLAIRVCNYFGGHVQRLQGDGIFVLFVRRGKEPYDALIGALNASAILTYFIKNEFGPAIQEIGIEKPIRIRTGIDFGPDEKVLWSRYGIPGCDELTTTSVHTDMAAKLQQRAPSFGVMIGDNVRGLLDLDSSLLSIRTYQENGITQKDESFTISKNYKYKFWVFDWEKYLLKYACCERSGTSIIFVKPEKRLKCIRQDTGYEYIENSYALPKGVKLRFEVLNRHGEKLVNFPPQKIEWKILNTGKEASRDEKLEIPIPLYNSSMEIEVDTAYLGQHKIQCKIGTWPNSSTLEFHVFVRSNYLLPS